MLQAGAWLKAERAKRSDRCSTGKIAALATVLARRQGDPITIHQQQISDIENATEDRGPKKLQPWFRYVRALVDTGQLDEALTAMDAPVPAELPGNTYLIQTASGEVVGRIVWEKPPL